MPPKALQLLLLLCVIALVTAVSAWMNARARSRALAEALELSKDTANKQEETLKEMGGRLARLQREQPSVITNERLKLLEKLIVIDDHIQRALKHGQGASASALYEGLQLCAQDLDRAWLQCGLTRVQAAPGVAFDPTLHEAVSSRPSDKPGRPEVAEALQDGFQLDDRLLRPAMVVVTVPSADAVATPEATDDEVIESGDAPTDEEDVLIEASVPPSPKHIAQR